MSPAAKTLVVLIKLYQKTLSPDHGILFSHLYPHGCCKFHPTCSEYATQAISRYGGLSGSWLAAKRVLRCNPLSAGGIDEVPIKSSKQ
jgi:uncharacterized protein